MYEFKKIKLVVWDLDETFWKGTITEGNVEISNEVRKLIIDLTDIGIVNSICSKNDFEPVKEKLIEEDLWDYFVFPSIDWNAKGNRVKELISDMQLRPQNVLFIDDNHLNLEEVKYFCSEIMAEDPSIISQLIEDTNNSEKKDLNHKRLKQYKVLEEKREEKSHYSSNEEFLMESNIKLEIAYDCENQIERIHDLLLRSNQLNFTKVRSSKEELEKLFNDSSIDKGYISVYDRFGDYGIIGFYAVKDETLLHFVFSCRTLGMGIEQYVYNWLNRPKLDIVGEVISDLSSVELPKWINQDKKCETESKMTINQLSEHQVLVKGPCDLYQIYPYIAQTELFDTEFTYVVENGLTIESTGHTTHIVESLRLTQKQKELVISEVPFTDMGMYNDNIFKNTYKVVFISILTDANLGVYQRKETGEKLAFLEYIHPITDPKNWDKLISGEYNCGGFKFTKEILQDFSSKYKFIGRNTPDQIVENLKFIRSNLPNDCMLVIMLGGELYYEKNEFEAYMDRHLVHKEINSKIRELANNTNGIKLMDVNKYLVDQSSFYDHFNHYVKPVYYNLAKEMVDIVNECTNSNINETSKAKMILIRAKEIIAPTYYKIRKVFRSGKD